MPIPDIDGGYEEMHYYFVKNYINKESEKSHLKFAGKGKICNYMEGSIANARNRFSPLYLPNVDGKNYI